MPTILSCAYWPCVCLFIINVCKFLIHFRHNFRIRYLICKCFLSFFSLFFRECLSECPCNRSNLFIFTLVLCALDVLPEKALPSLRLRRFAPRFSTKTFLVLALVFRSINRVGLTFVYSVSKGSSFTVLLVGIRFPGICWRGHVPTLNFLGIKKSIGHSVRFVPGSSFHSICTSVLVPAPPLCRGHHRFAVSLKSGSVCPPPLLFFNI